MELLARFELATSSLPKNYKLFLLVVVYWCLLPQKPAFTRLFKCTCCKLLSFDSLCFSLVFCGCLGFVLVLIHCAPIHSNSELTQCRIFLLLDCMDICRKLCSQSLVTTPLPCYIKTLQYYPVIRIQDTKRSTYDICQDMRSSQRLPLSAVLLELVNC